MNVAPLAPTLLAALVPLASLTGAAAGDDPPRPNVLVVVADDLGWGDVGYHGGEAETPSIDRLAAEGLELDRFYVHPLCSVTRAALMTGRLPMRIGVTRNFLQAREGLSVDERLVSQAFQAAGYQTCLVGKWHLGGTTDERWAPGARGFEHFYGMLGGAVDYFTHRDSRGNLDWQRNGEEVVEEGYATDLLAGEAVRWLRGLRARDEERPFFLVLSFNAVHAPLAAPAELLERFAGVEDEARRTMLAAIAAMDSALGTVLAALDELELARDTLVLFFSDNGARPAKGGDNGPLRGDKGRLHEGGIRVPALMRWPGVLPEGKTELVVTATDLFPTLAAAAGIPTGVEVRLDGRDLWTHLKNGEAPPAEAVMIGCDGVVVLHGRWKLLFKPAGGPTQLYDLFADPFEEHDLAAAEPDVVAQLEWYAQGLVDDADSGPTSVTGRRPRVNRAGDDEDDGDGGR